MNCFLYTYVRTIIKKYAEKHNAPSRAEGCSNDIFLFFQSSLKKPSSDVETGSVCFAANTKERARSTRNSTWTASYHMYSAIAVEMLATQAL